MIVMKFTAFVRLLFFKVVDYIVKDIVNRN